MLKPAARQRVVPEKERQMADDLSKRGGPDRGRVAGSQQYEIAHFAKKHGISADEARRIIHMAGPGRDKADEAAKGRSGKLH